MKSTRVLAAAVLTLATLPAAAQNQLWIDQLGSSSYDSTSGAAPDGSGGLYVSGSTFANLGGSSAGGFDPWLARYDGAGNQVWIRQFGTSTTDHSTDSAPDGSGGVYVTGYTFGSLGGPNAGDVDAWFARYDSAGNQLWIRQFGTSMGDRPYAVASDGAGGAYLSGDTLGSLGGPNAGNYDAWFARYDGAGNQLWIRQIGTTASEVAGTVTSDTLGGVYFAGRTLGNLGGPHAGQHDGWLARYDGAGNALWILQLGTSAEDYVYDAASDGSGGVYLSGETAGNLAAPNAGGFDAVVARYDSAGNQLWIRQFGTVWYDTADFAEPDASGGAYVGGYTYGDLAALNGNGGTGSTEDPWLARYDGAGNRVWTRQFGTNTYDSCSSAASDGSGGVYVVGQTNGSLGGTNAGEDDAWFARYDSSCPTPTTYCTGKANSIGCTPVIAMSNVPSVSAGVGCKLTTTNVIGAKNGLYFHSTSGANGAPFHGGFLCVKAPTKRHAVKLSGGFGGTCSGSFNEDLDVYIAAGTDPALVAGAQVWIQNWSRDPGALFTDSLSNAVTATICP